MNFKLMLVNKEIRGQASAACSKCGQLPDLDGVYFRVIASTIPEVKQILLVGYIGTNSKTTHSALLHKTLILIRISEVNKFVSRHYRFVINQKLHTHSYTYGNKHFWVSIDLLLDLLSEVQLGCNNSRALTAQKSLLPRWPLRSICTYTQPTLSLGLHQHVNGLMSQFLVSQRNPIESHLPFFYRTNEEIDHAEFTAPSQTRSSKCVDFLQTKKIKICCDGSLHSVSKSCQMRGTLAGSGSSNPF